MSADHSLEFMRQIKRHMRDYIEDHDIVDGDRTVFFFGVLAALLLDGFANMPTTQPDVDRVELFDGFVAAVRETLVDRLGAGADGV